MPALLCERASLSALRFVRIRPATAMLVPASAPAFGLGLIIVPPSGVRVLDLAERRGSWVDAMD